jgi:predicted ATPase/DNA-binding CsgD family transcriptional regulator
MHPHHRHIDEQRPELIPLSGMSPVVPLIRQDDPLTAREWEIVNLVTRGQTNREIADSLVIALSTAERHVANILNKLQLRSRTELALWAVEHGPVATGASPDGAWPEAGSAPLRGRTVGRRAHNLPVQVTSLIGREREVATIKRRLLEPHTHLVTLTGPGGVGKTRVALQVAAELLHEFTDGVFEVQLAPLNDATQVLSTIIRVVRIREQIGATPLSTLTHFLSVKSLLLVLDNFEHLLLSAAAVADLVAACPRLKVLVTSRAPLRVYGEQDISVAPLQVPVPPWPAAELLIQNDAVRLLIERSHAVNSDFHVTDQTAPTLAEICVHLDGLPLAIELAAAHTKLLPPEAILARLKHRLNVLVDGPRDKPPRQQTLRRTLEWSYDLLDAGSQVQFRQLAVFAGGFTLEAAKAVWGIDEVCIGEKDDVLNGLSVLVDQSLLRQEAGVFGEPRFGMLETVREYALEQLEAHEEDDAARRRHADYFVALGEQAMPELNAGPEHARWLARLALERDNLRTAMRWCIEAGLVDDGLQLAGAVWRFWLLEGTHSEREEWLQAIVGLASGGASPALRARALNGAGPLAIRQGDLKLAQTLLDRGLAIARELHDLHGIAFCLHNLGALAVRRADFAKAWTLLDEAAATWRNAGDRRREVITLNMLAGHVAEQGDYAGARARYAGCVAAYMELGDETGVANAQALFGLMAFLDGDVAEAQTLCESSLELARKVGHRATIAWNCLDLALVRLHMQEYRAALQLCAESLLLRDNGDQAQERVAAALGMLAGIATATGQSERALRLFAASEQCLRASNTMFPFFVRIVRERWETQASRLVGKDAAASAMSWGRSLSPEEAVAYALGAVPADI